MAKRLLTAGIILLLWTCRSPASTALDAVLEPVRNGGFEQAAGNRPEAWEFEIHRGAAATCAVDSTAAHSGGRSLLLRSDSGMAPNVYGRLLQTLPVLPSTRYVLSAWVKGEKVQGGQHFTDWRTYTLHLPQGTFGWTRVSTTFTTKPGQESLDVGLNIVNLARGLWLDDVSLTPELSPLKSRREGVRGAMWLPAEVVGDRQAALARLFVEAPEGFRGRAEFEVTAGGRTLARGRRFLGGGFREMCFTWNTGAAAVSTIRCRAAVLDGSGRIAAEGGGQVRKISQAVLRRRLDDVEAGLDSLRRGISQARAAGVPVDYPVVTQTVVEHFLPWTREDIEKGELVRADYAAGDMLRSLKNARAELEAWRRRPSLAPQTARFVSSDIGVSGGSFIADVRRGGKVQRGPVFFCGYGHFGQVRKDVEIFPDYGVNIIQIEFGPSRVLTSETETSDAPVEECLDVLDRAARSNVAVNLLLSPHYFPGWALEKWPHLGACRGGFIKYCIDAPEAKQVIEKFLRYVIPHLRGKPALHSICLSNEPIYVDSRGCEYTRRMWADYMRRKHGSVASMNETLGTGYSSFEEVPIPEPREFDSPVFYDWCVFNQERFSGWHEWMAGIIHEMAPEIPVHAKIMPIIWNRSDIAYGVDPEQFCALGQIDGNDCWIGYPGGGDWANSWQTQNSFYDLLRSMRKQPVFNSENHITADRSTHYYPPEHFRMALWQGAVHGQGATTIWVWERTYDRKSDFYGNVMHRPGCAEAVGRTCLDLLRLAPEVTALQDAPSPVAILYSVASIVGGEEYLDELDRAYEALNFTGVKINFISEKQIQEGGLVRYSLLVIPAAGRVMDATFEGIRRFALGGGRIVATGDALGADEYGRRRSAGDVDGVLQRAARLEAGLSGRALWLHLLEALSEAGAPEVECVEAASGQPAWGVEWLSVRDGGSLLINAVNLTKRKIAVRFRARGGELWSFGHYRRVPKTPPDEVLQVRVAGRDSSANGKTSIGGLTDLLSGRGRRQPITLEPLKPVLVRARRP